MAELIIRYEETSGEEDFFGIARSVTVLRGGYAIADVDEDRVIELVSSRGVLFAEIPTRLFFAENRIRSYLPERTRIIRPQLSRDIQSARGLDGEGIIVAVIDSGIDYRHPDFIDDNGNTRIVELWDQTVNSGMPPKGYAVGSVYDREMINRAIRERTFQEAYQIVPSNDVSGHGTHVAGIAAGNGRASDGRIRGVAYGSSLLIVKLGDVSGVDFPRTTRLMEAVNYCYDVAIRENMPLVINLSFGNNYGAHNGRSLVESYIDFMAQLWKSNIVIGTGNEANKRNHVGGILNARTPEEIELAVGENEGRISFSVWKNYNDIFEVEIVAPNRQRAVFNEDSGELFAGIIPGSRVSVFKLMDTEINVIWTAPTPYQKLVEISVAFAGSRTGQQTGGLQQTGIRQEEDILQTGKINTGIWRIRILPSNIVSGEFDVWLTMQGAYSLTGFVTPTPERTLTVPSTAFGAVSVGAYNEFTEEYAVFSGRGYPRDSGTIKPDVVAPGVDITSAAPGGGYSVRSGTSMAAPFVSGKVAQMMQYGIIQGNDPYMYGEKVKSVLIRNALPIGNISDIPNRRTGWGRVV